MSQKLSKLILILTLIVGSCTPQVSDETQRARQTFEALSEAYRPNDNFKKSLDSLDKIALQLQDDSLHLAIMIYKAGYYSDIARPDSVEYMLKLSKPFLNPKDFQQTIFYYRQEGLFHENKNNYVEAIISYQRALDLALEDKDNTETRGLLKTHLSLAMCLASIGNMSEAQKQFQQAQAFLSTDLDVYTQAHFYRMHASFFEQSDRRLDAIRTAQKGLDLLKNEDEDVPEKNILRMQQATSLLSLFINKQSMHLIQPDSIESRYHRLIEIEKKHLQRPYLLSMMYENLSMYHQEKHNYIEAKKFLTLANELSGHNAYLAELKGLSLELAIAERNTEQIQNEIQQLQSYILQNLSPSPRHTSNAYKAISKGYEALGKLQEASRIKDSVVAYEQEMREVEKAALAYNAKQNKELKEAIDALSEEETLKDYYRAALYLLLPVSLLLLYAIYLRYRKQRIEIEQNLNNEQKKSLILSVELSELNEKLDALKEDKKKRLTPQKEQDILNKLEHLMGEEKVYLSPQISLENIAEELETNRTYLSQIINANLGCSFPDYVARFRIDEAKRLLLTMEYKTTEIYKLLGFGSQSAFYTAFKRLENGATPNEWLKTAKEQRSSRDKV